MRLYGSICPSADYSIPVSPVRSPIHLAALAIVTWFLVPAGANAQNTWTGGTVGTATTASWDIGTNWSTAAKPIATDDVIFPTPIPTVPGATITLSAGELANSLTFNDSYTLNSLAAGGDLTLTTGNVTVATGKTATFGTVLKGTAGLNFAVVGGSGTATVILNGASTYTGITTINSGITAKLGSATAFGAGGVNTDYTTVLAGGAIDLNNQALANEEVRIAGTGVGGSTGAIFNSSGTATVITNLRFVRLTADATITTGTRIDIRRVGTTAGNETLDLATFTLTKSGTNTLALVDTAIVAGSTGGSVNVTAGTLSIESTTSFTTGTGSITLSGTNTLLSLFGLTGLVNRPVVLGTSTIVGDINSTSPNSALASPITVSGNANITIQSPVTGANGTQTFSGPFTTTGNFTLTKAGPGLAVLTNAGNAGAGYTGSFNIAAGGVQFNAAAAIPGTGANITVASGGTAVFNFTGVQAVLAQLVNTSAGVVAVTTASAAENLDFSAAGANLTAASLGAFTGQTVTYSGTLTPNGTTYRLGGGNGALTVSVALTGASNSLVVGTNGTTASTVTLTNAANSFGGGTTVNGGQVLVITGTDGVAGSATGLLGAVPATATNNITLNASTLRFGSAATTLAPTRSIVLGSGGGIIDTNGNSYVLGNAFSGITGFTKTGGGTLTLASALPTGAVTLIGGGNLTLNAATQSVGVITVGSGTVTQPNSQFYPTTIANGVLNLNGTTTATGLTIGGGVSASGQVNIATGASLTVNAGTNDINIGMNTSAAGDPTLAVKIIGTGTAALSMTAKNINLGGNAAATANRPNVVVQLGSGTNILSATTSINLQTASNGGIDGDGFRNDALGQVIVALGAGSNTITTPLLNIGNWKSPAAVYLAPLSLPSQTAAGVVYASPVLIQGATLSLSGLSGGKVTLVIGNQSQGATGTNSVGNLDTTGGVVTANAGTITLGFNANAPTAGNGGALGSWVLGVGANNVTVDSILMTNTPNTTQGITGAVFSLNGGQVKFNNGGSGFKYGNTASFTNTNINLNGGTLDLNGQNVLDATAPLPLDTFGFNGGTFKNATSVFVTGGLTQGAGTILRDATGNTTIINNAANLGANVYILGGGATIQLNSAATTSTVGFSAGSLARSAAGGVAGTLDIVPFTGALAGIETVKFTGTAPTTTNGILAPWVVARTSGTGTVGADFTFYDATNGVSRFAGYATGDLNTASSTAVANVGNTVLTASPTVYALKLTGAVTDSGTNTLTLGVAGLPAGLLLDGGSVAAAGGLTIAGNEAVIYTTPQNGTLSSAISVTGGLTKFGAGTLTLSAAAGNSISGATNVNGGTLVLANTSGSATGAGAVNVRNGATLTGIGFISATATNGVAFGPGAVFAPGSGGSFGVTTIATVSGNVTTAAPVISPIALSTGTPNSTLGGGSAADANGLHFGLGLSPTNVVGSVFRLNLGSPNASGASDTGASTTSLGGNASGFTLTSTSGKFTLNPITTIQVTSSASFSSGTSYSYLIGTVPSGSSGTVTNAGNFDFSAVSAAVNNPTFDVIGTNVYLNFSVAAAVPEPGTILGLAAAGLGIGRLVGRRLRRSLSL